MSPPAMMIIAAFIAGLMLPASADAASMRVTTGLNLRTGPGASYARITVIPGGGWVDLIGRSGNWCDVSWAGYRGWVACRYLAGGYYYPDRSPRVFFDFFLGPWIFDHDRDRHYRPHYRVPPRRDYRRDRAPEFPWPFRGPGGHDYDR
ncbi:MAG: SH3 domain-containing protein [Hyphomicrobiales bacterium]|nr:SH3 domain-containing protein [Hyphomicrobiales bacterium]